MVHAVVHEQEEHRERRPEWIHGHGQRITTWLLQSYTCRPTGSPCEGVPLILVFDREAISVDRPIETSVDR